MIALALLLSAPSAAQVRTAVLPRLSAAPALSAGVPALESAPAVTPLSPPVLIGASLLPAPAAPSKPGEPPAEPAAVPAGPIRLDETARLKSLQKAVRAGTAGALPAKAKDFKYLLVPGILWDAVEGYMEPNLARLKSLGLDADIVRVDPLGQPKDNAKSVAAAVKGSDKPVILLAHSKGGIDSLEALAKHPSLEGKVEAVAAIQTPYFGTPVADFFRGHPWLRAASLAYSRLLNPWRVLSVNPFFRGGTIESLSTRVRSALSRDTPPETRGARLYSVASRVDEGTALKLLLWISAGTVKTLSGVNNDGIVSPEDAAIPGARSAVLEHVGHIDTISEPSRWKHKALGVRGHDPSFAADLTEAVVRWILGADPK